MNTTLPSWLDTSPITSVSPATSNPPKPVQKVERFPRTLEELTLQELTYDNLFERLLDETVEGRTIEEVVESDNRGVRIAPFLRWIRSDKKRNERWREAKRLWAEVAVNKLSRIGSGADSMNDHNRDKLHADMLLKQAAYYDSSEFGVAQNQPVNNGNQPIVINIGTVDSPYAKQVEVIDNTPQISVSDVESRPSDT